MLPDGGEGRERTSGRIRSDCVSHPLSSPGWCPRNWRGGPRTPIAVPRLQDPRGSQPEIRFFQLLVTRSRTQTGHVTPTWVPVNAPTLIVFSPLFLRSFICRYARRVLADAQEARFAHTQSAPGSFLWPCLTRPGPPPPVFTFVRFAYHFWTLVSS